MKSNIDLPFSIGERLYHVTFLNNSCDTNVAFIDQYRHPVEGVQIDRNGTPRPVIDGHAMPFNTVQAAASRKDALKILAAQHPGAIYLDGKSRREIFYANCASSGRVRMTLSRAAIKQYITGPLVTNGPEPDLIVIQSDARYKRADDPVSGYRFGPDNRVTHVMTGPFLCLKTVMRPDGLREVADIPADRLPYADPRTVPDGLKGAYRPESWTVLSGMTVDEFAKYLCRNFPKDARLHVRNLDGAAVHFSPYRYAVILDDDPQPGLPEYQGHEPRRVKGEAACDDDECELFSEDGECEPFDGEIDY